MGKLDGKVALVTGSGRNIGRAIALRLADEGAHVIVNARRNQDEADAVAAEVRARGVKSLAILANMAQLDQIDAMVDRAVSELGQIDILVNNAAIRPQKPFRDATPQDWEAVRRVILDGALHLTHAVIGGMLDRKYGRILFFVGEAAFAGHAGRTLVSAAKHGLVGLARSMAAEYAGDNIRVNIVSPGSINTRRDNPEWYAARGGPTVDGLPMGRQGSVEEIAGTCLFLIGDDSGYITGQTIHVNGGSSFH